MDRLSSSASTASSIDDYFEHNMWNPLLELLFGEQTNGIVASYLVGIDVAKIALSCRFALDLLSYKEGAFDSTSGVFSLSTTAANRLHSGDAHAFRLVETLTRYPNARLPNAGIFIGLDDANSTCTITIANANDLATTSTPASRAVETFITQHKVYE